MNYENSRYISYYLYPGIFAPVFTIILFLLENGFDKQLFIEQMFDNYISSFFVMDVIISAIVLIVFVVAEGKRLEMQYWWVPILATFTVGVSLGLPLSLYSRQLHLEKT
ncbi:MAG: DUF2834 domain-containing protein [Candidatus Hodarchaeota archaeon]